MSELDQRQLQQLKHVLLERREALWTEVADALKKSGHESLTEMQGQVHDTGEESVADMLADLDVASVSAEAEELTDIEATLIRMKKGTYGDCIDCGEPINAERLNAHPTAKRCFECQNRHEDNRSNRDATPSL